MDRVQMDRTNSLGSDMSAGSRGTEFTMIVVMSEAAGLDKPYDVYCVCTLCHTDLFKEPTTPRGIFSKKDPVPPQTCRTETVKKTDRPKWRTGRAEFLVRDVGPGTFLELSLMSQKMFGSTQLGRARVDLMDLIGQPHIDRYEEQNVEIRFWAHVMQSALSADTTNRIHPHSL